MNHENNDMEPAREQFLVYQAEDEKLMPEAKWQKIFDSSPGHN